MGKNVKEEVRQNIFTQNIENNYLNEYNQYI